MRTYARNVRRADKALQERSVAAAKERSIAAVKIAPPGRNSSIQRFYSVILSEAKNLTSFLDSSGFALRMTG